LTPPGIARQARAKAAALLGRGVDMEIRNPSLSVVAQ
jgi:hypothetical protein